MKVSELIEHLKALPNQDDRVVFTYASEVDGCQVIDEVQGSKLLTYRDIYTGKDVKAVELE